MDGHGMNERIATLETIERGGVIAVLRGVSAETLEEIATALVDGGITAVEVTANTSGVSEKIETLADIFADEDVVVGAGTVLDGPTARTVHLAGAEFIVTPTLNEDVIRVSNRYGVPVVPGVFTPSEALEASELGADAVKLFPASSVGPAHISAINGPLPQIDIIPTGGINQENTGAYIEAGATAVGAGSSLVPDEAVRNHDWERIERRAKAFVHEVENARS